MRLKAVQMLQSLLLILIHVYFRISSGLPCKHISAVRAPKKISLFEPNVNFGLGILNYIQLPMSVVRRIM